ncbi:hypothetical protein FOA43_002331 [Brettanomyces nanus]|uniref:Protein-lysine N-methyltransferase EFM4 n=1 Tax=Eeniella nana TaxID=13502 RepID=A0A875RZN0_EENNA|nr:uncharacterized protein FOA43_002331 [Brettanomyces nanus]QPG74991.1 hypothetical protein FOA43_002331 [Brettanomyces nanus]
MPPRVSVLGTKKHWDSVYAQEHLNYRNNSKDLGECWYSDSDAEEKIGQFVLDHFKRGKTGGLCDLGTGNGHLLLTLSKMGLLNSNMVGIDYSQDSVSFATDLVNSSSDDQYTGICFYRSNFLLLNDQFLNKSSARFGLIIDKGTLDAIYLSTTKYEDGKRSGIQIYPARVASMMKPAGILLVTSCNFTAKELIKTVTKDGIFKYWTQLHYPVFEFGGFKGSAVNTIAFRLIDR